MAQGSGYFKGEKKKQKRGKEKSSSFSTAPTFVLPEIIAKKKQTE